MKTTKLALPILISLALAALVGALSAQGPKGPGGKGKGQVVTIADVTPQNAATITITLDAASMTVLEAMRVSQGVADMPTLLTTAITQVVHQQIDRFPSVAVTAAQQALDTARAQQRAAVKIAVTVK